MVQPVWDWEDAPGVRWWARGAYFWFGSSVRGAGGWVGGIHRMGAGSTGRCADPGQFGGWMGLSGVLHLDLCLAVLERLV